MNRGATGFLHPDAGRFEMANVASSLDLLPPPIRTRTDWQPALPSVSPLKIGPLEVGFPVIQAALSGYSDWPMRVVARRLGAPYTLAEVMIDRVIREMKDRQRTRHWFMVSDEEHPVGAQLMGSDPAGFADAARRLVECGFDVIDINFGCPVKSAIGGCRGGYHLGQPEVALDIVGRVRDSVPDRIPVTLKMRRGIDDSSESRDRFFSILDGAFARGIAAITVHGRTVEQKYNGPSNWDFLREVKQHAGSRTIIGSGDAFTARDCVDMLSYTGVDGVSAARGAIGNPWIFRQTRDILEGRPAFEPPLAEQRRVMEMQLELCLRIYDEHETTATMRRFGVRFAQLHSDFESVRNAFGSSRTLSEWRHVLETWYGPVA